MRLPRTHFLTLFCSVGDDDSFPVVALEWDIESSQRKTVFSAGKGWHVSSLI